MTATSALPNRTVTRTLTARATQAITFDQELSGRVGDVIALSASGGGSGEPVTFASATPDVCSTGGANGATLTLQAASTCEVRARQAGNVNFEAAPETARSFAVEKGVQASLVFTPKSPIVFGEEVTLAASGGDGIGAVTFAVVDGGAYCAVSGNTLTATGADGACTVRASKAGDANYEGTSEDAVVTVSPRQAQAELSIVGGPLSFPGSLTLSVTGGTTSGAVTYELLSGPCTLAGAVLSSTGIGTCTVRATMAGSGGYLEVVSAALGVTVSRNRVVEEAARRMQQAMLAKGRAMLSYNPGADRMAAGKRSGPSVAVLPQGDSRQGSIAFATSLREIAQAAEKGDRHVVPTAADRPDALPDPVPRAAGSLDLWADGRIVWFDSEDDGDSQRGFLGEVGIDYLITEALLLGVSLRLDVTSGDVEDSRGWMVGPYAVAEVAPGLRLDGRLLWGRGSGDLGIGLSGVTYEGDYESTRWLAEAGVRGEIDLAPVALEPGLRVSWWREEADRYSLSNGGGSVEDQELSLLRIALDPRLSYSTTTQGSLMASPYLKPQLIAEWQDQKGNGEGWDIFGAVEAGLSVSGPSYSFGARVEASGLGSDQGRSFGAGAELSIPLN
ncbi:MAG: autotransporter outer membrane beta-barrel domain-containing protein [Aestuariivirga sp.]|nr:autotransporter outer membrane beta-barrel domain-containing protein [Aestuariivirga sp.]